MNDPPNTYMNPAQILRLRLNPACLRKLRGSQWETTAKGWKNWTIIAHMHNDPLGFEFSKLSDY